MSKYSLAAKTHKMDFRHLTTLNFIITSLFQYAVWVNIIVCILTLALLALYLFNMNSLTSEGYQLKLLKGEQEELKKQQIMLSAQLSKAQSMAEVNKRLVNLPFEKMTSVEYLSLGGASFAYDEGIKKE